MLPFRTYKFRIGVNAQIWFGKGEAYHGSDMHITVIAVRLRLNGSSEDVVVLVIINELVSASLLSVFIHSLLQEDFQLD